MTDIAERIERVYRALERPDAPPERSGARAWFARRARLTPRHVSRLIAGEHPLDGPVLSVLELLEEQARGR